MTDVNKAMLTVSFRKPGRSRKPTRSPHDRIPRVARLLALAHEIDRRIREGELDDLAHAARALGLSRARVTQITNLRLLSPEIQEILLLTSQGATLPERLLRPSCALISWKQQSETTGTRLTAEIPETAGRR